MIVADLLCAIQSSFDDCNRLAVRHNLLCNMGIDKRRNGHGNMEDLRMRSKEIWVDGGNTYHRYFYSCCPNSMIPLNKKQVNIKLC